MLSWSCKDGGLGIIKLVVWLAQSSDEALVTFLKGEHLEVLYEKLWVQAGGRRSPSQQFENLFQWRNVLLVEVKVCQNGRPLFQKSILDLVISGKLSLINGSIW